MTSAADERPAGVDRVRARFASERGNTLIEVLIVIALLATVLGVLMSPITGANVFQQRMSNYSVAQQSATASVEAIVAQVRQATAIISSGPNSVWMNITLRGQALQVYYECDITQPGTAYRECVRVSAPQGGTLPSLSQGTVVARDLTDGTTTNPVFSWGVDPNAPDYMTATLDVPASDGRHYGFTHTIVVSDGTLMRNLNVEN